MSEELPKPHNGPCDRADKCHYASQKCREPFPDYPLDWTDWEATPLRTAPNRRWIDCTGWKLTLGMVYNPHSGSWVYPVTPEHFGFKQVKEYLFKRKEE